MSDTHHDPGLGVELDVENDVREPRRYRVLLHNDDYTTMDFVVRILKDVFNKTDVQARNIMLKVHHDGVGICGEYTAEVAETKVNLVHSLARKEGFPLKSSMEEV